MASHDRAFLDATVSRIWELRDRRLTIFRGDYSAYHRQREERDARAVKEADSQADAIERERQLVQRYRSFRNFSKMHEHEARLERLRTERVEAPRRRRALQLPADALAGDGPSRSGELVVRADELEVGYLAPVPGREPPKVVARAAFLAASRGERIGIVGPNGAGKTTLLRTIAGELPALDGTLAFGHNVGIGYLAQLRGAAIAGTTVLEAILDALPVTPGEARSYLARFLFRGDDVFKEIRALSGGERSRLELALLGILPSNLLLLDEPTNHLDVVAREAIEAFLRGHAGTILVVSHDRRLLETICERLWVVEDGLAVEFDGGYRAWRAAIADGWTPATAVERERSRIRSGGAQRTARPGGPTNGPAGVRAERPPAEAGMPGREARRGAAGRPRLSKDAYRRRLAVVEADLTRLGLRKNHLELALGDPAVQSNFVELRRVTSELADIESALSVAEETWLELEEQAPAGASGASASSPRSAGPGMPASARSGRQR